MLRSINELKEYAITATDGAIGHVKNFYFDDESWAIRYLIVETGLWLFNRNVLISPKAIGIPEWSAKSLPVAITKEQVEHSPEIDTDKPVSRQHEDDYLRYYDYPRYWIGGGLWGVGIYPDEMMQGYANNPTVPDSYRRNESINRERKIDHDRHQDDDSHLRSYDEVIGYHLHAKDGDIGHVTDMLVDEKTWAIRYLLIETGNWWSNHTVLIAPQWIEHVQLPEKRLTVSLSQQEVKDAPLYDGSVPLDREFESAIHAHYRRKGYWLHEEEQEKFTTADR